MTQSPKLASLIHRFNHLM